jgi:hypothetical protein
MENAIEEHFTLQVLYLVEEEFCINGSRLSCGAGRCNSHNISTLKTQNYILMLVFYKPVC